MSTQRKTKNVSHQWVSWTTCITASRHVLNMTPNRSYTYNALLSWHSIHIIGIMQCHTTKKFWQNTNEITMYVLFQLIHPIHKNFLCPVFMALLLLWSHSGRINATTRPTLSTIVLTAEVHLFILHTKTNLDWKHAETWLDCFTCYMEHPALGKLCIWISHWHTSNGNWFLKNMI